MGKRKERRLAAKSNVGRRFKLDLFAEPSGDLGGSSVHDEVEGDLDPKHQAGLPNSPTSSGQQSENPLLLLGQYSDDELDEESNERSNHATLEDSLAENIDEAERASGEGHEDTNVNAIEDLAAEKVKQQEMENDYMLLDALQNLEGCDTRESDTTASGDLCKAMGSAEQISNPGTTDVKVVGEVSAAGWKMVMHEESKQYYYWNTETGETSWEVPEVLACTRDLAHGLNEEKLENASVSKHELNSMAGVELSGSSDLLATDSSMDPNLILQSKGDHASRNNEWMGHNNEAPNIENGGTYRSDVISSCGAVDATSGDKCSTAADTEKYALDTRANEEHKSVIDVSSRILRRCEYLLERLKSLKGSKNHLHGRDWMEKYILEVEIRLSDCKALLSYGSSLHPFWVHSERQLKRLESIIDDEAGQLVKCEQAGEIEATGLSSLQGKDKIKRSTGHDSEPDVIENKIVCSTPENPRVSSYVDTVPVSAEVPFQNDTSAGFSYGLPTEQLGSGELVSEQVSGSALCGESTSHLEFHAGEDIDMDVDMEVEDAAPVANSNIRNASSSKDFALSEPQVEPNQSADQLSFVSDDGFAIPPPPDEEWIPPPPPDNDNEQIPPPPPDNEQIPPPPPDEPPEPSYPAPPSYTETRQPLSYAELYNLSYPTSSFEYYGHMVTEVSNNNLYVHAEGNQVPTPHAPLYYESVPSTYAETAPIIVNPVDPIAYYGLQGGTVPPVPVVSSIESSQFHTGSGAMSYGTLASDQFGYTAAQAGPNVNVDGSAAGVDAQISSPEAPSTATIQALATVSAKESIAAAAAAAAPPKASKSKVLRAKKRTAAAPSLRSNKKVSSLVDKWKAAKEEMNNDEEEEPESAYEILEKKRQREIEEWRAKQIASGEARDNANFQPLGGDWRERVKRRRAQKASEAVETSPEAATDRSVPPDLIELSKNLPTGWQAYWDESSKLVYYGNTVTSETTWTRPAK